MYQTSPRLGVASLQGSGRCAAITLVSMVGATSQPEGSRSSSQGLPRGGASRSSARFTLPLAVFGSSDVNSTIRGYL